MKLIFIFQSFIEKNSWKELQRFLESLNEKFPEVNACLLHNVLELARELYDHRRSNGLETNEKSMVAPMVYTWITKSLPNPQEPPRVLAYIIANYYYRTSAHVSLGFICFDNNKFQVEIVYVLLIFSLLFFLCSFLF